MANARRYRDPELPKQADELARLKIIQGPDSGSVFVVSSSPAIMGRGDENDVVISDLKASRKHLELMQSPKGWVIRDLGSANGLVHNGEVVRDGILKSGDVIQLGETMFEFVPGDAATAMITAPVRSSDQVLADQAAFDAQRARVRAMAGVKTKTAKSGTHTALTRPIPSQSQSSGGLNDLLKNKKFLIYAAAGVAVYFFVFDDSSQQQKRAPAAQQKSKRDPASMMPSSDAVFSHSHSAEMFYKDGFREYTSKNYLRARQQFETALQVQPGHPLARLYLEKSNQAIEELTKHHLESGKKALAFGRYRQAKGHFETVMRSLHRDQSSPDFNEAKEQLQKTLKEMKGDSG